MRSTHERHRNHHLSDSRVAGLTVDSRMLFSYTVPLALCGAMLLIGFREAIQRRWLKMGDDAEIHLLFCPNFMPTALAAISLLRAGSRNAAMKVILCGMVPVLDFFAATAARQAD